MTKPIISYVIPCYNCQSTIAETVFSIKDTHEAYRAAKGLESQWDQIEVILVNDGSEDYTGSIIDELAIEYHNIIAMNHDNVGKGASRNAGNQMASADIIAVLDSDDWHITDRTAYILKAFEATPDADIFYSGWLAKHLENRHMGDEVPFHADKLNPSMLARTGEFGICHSTVAYKRETILKYPYSEDRNKDDWAMLWNLFTNGCKFIYTDKILVCYRIKESSYEKETDMNLANRIFKKKQKIMEPFFQGAA